MSVAEKVNDLDSRTVVCADRESWLQERQKGIGASESPAILGVGYAGTSPLSVWAEKVHGYRPEFTAEQLRRMERGKRMEAIITAELHEEMPDLPIQDPGEFTIFRHPDVPCMFATIDRLATTDEGLVPVELKNVSGRHWADWQEEPPLLYQVQCQHQMDVLGADICYLVALIGGEDLSIHRLERNEAFCAKLRAKLAEFWTLVESRTEPQDYSPEAAAAIKVLYPRESAPPVELDAEALEWDAELQTVKEQIRDLEKRRMELENRLKLAIKDAEAGILPDGTRYTWKVQQRKGYTVEPGEVRVLRRLKAKNK